MRTLLVSCFITLCAWCQCLAASSLDAIRFKRLLHGSEESSTVINTVHVTRQDPKGFIWFGGEHGLARYDGHEIKIYQHDPANPNSLTSNAIWDITFDRDGVMWLATDTGLGRYNPATDDFTSYRSRGFDMNTITGDSVRALAVDQHNNLLIGTDNGFSILEPKRRHYRSFTDRESDPFKLPDAAIHAILPEADGSIWLGTTKAGLLRLRLKPFSIEQFSHEPGVESSLSHNRITSIVRDYQGYLWVASFGGGISRMNADGKTFTHYRNNPDNANSLGSDTVWSLFEDRDHNLWIATDHGGLARYRRDSDDFEHLRHNPYDPQSLSSNNIRSIFEDTQGDLWVGTFPIGTNFFDRSSTVFSHHSHIPQNPQSLSHATVLTMEKSQLGHLWVGTEGGIDKFDPNTKLSERIVAEPGKKGRLQSNAVLSLAEEPSGDLWVGTWSGGLHKRDHKTGEFIHYPAAKNQPHTVNSAYIWGLLIDSRGYMWIGTETAGLNRYDFKTQTFKHYPVEVPATPQSVSNTHVWTLLEDKEGYIWAGSMHGLNRYDPATETFNHYFHEPDNKNSLTNNRIIALFEDSQQNLWVGTQGGGINILDKSRSQFSHIGVEQGLPSGNVASIIKDADKNIWVTTDKGIAKLNHKRQVIKTYTQSHGLVGNNFNRDASYLHDNGDLFLGSTSGISVFNPKALTKIEAPPEIILTELRIFNEPVTSRSENSPLTQSISDTKSITLNYEQRVFSVGFSALSYRSSHHNQYAYKLEGFDKEWVHSGNRHIASYTNISPGKYRLLIKAANAGGAWNEQGISLDIQILPPLWRTWWAYAIYTAVFLGLLIGFYRYKTKRVELIKEREVNAKLIKLDKMKDSFLANTSHELRTPLNGIIGLAESLRENTSEQLPAAQAHQLDMIISSGKRLSHLINDILDLSKLAEKRIELKKVPVDLRYQTDLVLALLAPLVDNKPINLINEIPNNFYAVKADENRLQQILFNLIGNGIKYSDKGFVKIQAQQNPTSTTISVRDTGIGIAQEDVPTIFQSFCQLESSDDREYGGTGLGLAITKQLIELHGGSIDVISQLGHGTTFFFTLPTSDVKLKAGTLPSKTVVPIAPAKVALTSDVSAATQHPSSKAATNGAIIKSNNSNAGANHATPLANATALTILAVDDDPVNRMVLNGILKKHGYQVIEAADGASAIAMVKAHPEIALVILDVMMPKMTGYKACKALRAEHPIHQLPIIFLTAKDIESELTQGFLVGGNDFVSKPVKKEELLARVKAQLLVTRQGVAQEDDTLFNTPVSTRATNHKS